MERFVLSALFLTAITACYATAGLERTDYPCPGPGDSCPLTLSCCLHRYLSNSNPEKTAYRYKCCPYPNAVCCGDFKTCCPDGTICSVEKDTCIHPNGTLSVMARFRNI